MKLTRRFSYSLLTVALSAVTGYIAVANSFGPPLQASSPTTQTNNTVNQHSDAGSSIVAGKFTADDKLALLNHNQAVKASAAQTGKKPNICIIWGDDIGWNNPSAYSRGAMGYQTPNIDRVAKEGGLFTDWYGQQSCTAGRAALITGQSPFRTGLLKVGLPGAKEGLSEKDPTIPGLLKNHGYMTAQYGKNNLGDRDEHLPTNHGFDEFYGNLYHLNAEQEPEHPDYFKNPELKKVFGPRGVIKSFANGKITDTGPLTIERMKTVDEEVYPGIHRILHLLAQLDKDGAWHGLDWAVDAPVKNCAHRVFGVHPVPEIEIDKQRLPFHLSEQAETVREELSDTELERHYDFTTVPTATIISRLEG